MSRARSSLSPLIPFASAAAGIALIAGANPGFGGTDTSHFEGARASLTACETAGTTLASAYEMLGQKDPAFRTFLDMSHNQMLDAIRAVRDASWPKEFRSVRRRVSAHLTQAELRLDQSERPGIAGRLRVVKTHTQGARRALKKAFVLLEGVVPPTPPDLQHDDPTSPPPVDPPTTSPDFTWTEFTPSSDSRIVYVSYSTGSDSNDGLSPEKPFKTFGPAGERMRKGYPDWILLKRGDVWDGTGGFGGMLPDLPGGRSQAEPQRIGTYGSSTQRPLLIDGRFRIVDGVKHVAVDGIQFKLSGGTSLVSFGVAQLGASSEDVLVEDCMLTGYPGNIQMDGQGKRSSNVRIRGCVLADSIIQGMLVSQVDGLLIEGCVFDHNGWREDLPGFEANGFNHNMYIQTDCTQVTVRNTISARASSHGLQQRPGGITEDNLFLQNPIAMNSFGNGKVRGNVILDSRDIGEAYRGMGIWLGSTNDMEVHDNIMAHQVNGTQPRAMEFDTPNGTLNIHDNIVYKWDSAAPNLTPIALYFSDRAYGTVKVTNNTFEMAGGLVVEHDQPLNQSVFTYTGNKYFSTASAGQWFFVENHLSGGVNAWKTLSGETGLDATQQTFPAADRTIATYSANLGKAASLDAFLTEARKQSRLNWRWEYTAKVANNYFRAGFGLSPR